MEGIFALVVLTLFVISIITLIRPIPRLNINTRQEAGGLLFLSFVLFVILGVIYGEEKETASLEETPAALSPPITSEPIQQARQEGKQSEATYSDAEKLTIIAAPGWGEREGMLKRFTFLLKEFETRCPPAKASSADMLVFSYQKIQEIGLGEEEGLLALSNTLYRLTVDIGGRTAGAQIDPPACSEVFAMYLTLRQNGQLPTEAREGVTAVVGALYGLIAE